MTPKIVTGYQQYVWQGSHGSFSGAKHRGHGAIIHPRHGLSSWYVLRPRALEAISSACSGRDKAERSATYRPTHSSESESACLRRLGPGNDASAGIRTVL
jgi:hypothetical protein